MSCVQSRQEATRFEAGTIRAERAPPNEINGANWRSARLRLARLTCGVFAKTRCFRHPYESPSTRSIINNTPELRSNLHRFPGIAARLPSAIATGHGHTYHCYSATQAYSPNLYARRTQTIAPETMLFAHCLE